MTRKCIVTWVLVGPLIVMSALSGRAEVIPLTCQVDGIEFVLQLGKSPAEALSITCDFANTYDVPVNGVDVRAAIREPGRAVPYMSDDDASSTVRIPPFSIANGRIFLHNATQTAYDDVTLSGLIADVEVTGVTPGFGYIIPER